MVVYSVVNLAVRTVDNLVVKMVDLTATYLAVWLADNLVVMRVLWKVGK